MTHVRRTLTRVLTLPLALTAWACQDGSTPTDLLDAPVAQSVIVDYEAGGGDQFLFLPPLSNGKPSAPMATGLELTVTICDPSDDCEVATAKEEDDHYQVNWKSDKAQDGVEYDVTVKGSDVVLGSLAITLEKKGKDKAGSTFPIKFWVGETLGDAVEEFTECVGDDRCNAAPVPPSTTETTTIVTEDENGATMGELTFPPASVPEGGLIVTLDCREGGYAPGDGPLPTDLDQWPLFCHVDVKNPDGTAFTGALVTDASIEICVVDEDEAGQAPYHGFVDHNDLRLGKSSTGSDFMFLPAGPETLDCSGATTQTASTSPAGRFFDAVGSRLAWAMSPLLPKKLYARRMFRDGGVGGLVSSFSDINPVQPAVIAGTVSLGGGGAGIGGVTVTLTGGPLTSPLVTATDVDGIYAFSPLQAEVGGSAYTVTVSDLPPGETVASSVQNVSVTGSGTFTADFETELPAGIFYNPDNGNFYQAVATPVSWPDARIAAEAMTFRACVGHLATVTSAAENAFIVTNMPQVTVGYVGGSPFGGGYWIGGFQPGGADADYPNPPYNPWAWVTGEPFGAYTNWGTGEPNNQGNDEHVLHFYGDWNPSEATTWNDEPDYREYGYVVEYECDPLPAAPSAYLVPSMTFDTPINGGPGGGVFTGLVDCPAGAVAVGLKGNATNYYGWAALWDVGIVCRELLPDGTLGTLTVVGNQGDGFGTSSDVPFAANTCTSGQVMVSLNGSTTISSGYVNTIGADCGTVSRVTGALGGSDSSIGPWTGSGVMSSGPWAESCPNGYAVTGLIGRSGNIIDAVGVRCTQIIDAGA